MLVGFTNWHRENAKKIQVQKNLLLNFGILFSLSFYIEFFTKALNIFTF